MAMSENLKFGSTIGSIVALIISVWVGASAVTHKNQENYMSLKEEIAHDRVSEEASIRDNAEAVKDMLTLFTLAQEADDNRIRAIETSRWSINQEAENAARNAIANPGVRYADPKNAGHFFYVEPLQK